MLLMRSSIEETRESEDTYEYVTIRMDKHAVDRVGLHLPRAPKQPQNACTIRQARNERHDIIKQA
jgi:hypothetical protein